MASGAALPVYTAIRRLILMFLDLASMERFRVFIKEMEASGIANCFAAMDLMIPSSAASAGDTTRLSSCFMRLGHLVIVHVYRLCLPVSGLVIHSVYPSKVMEIVNTFV